MSTHFPLRERVRGGLIGLAVGEVFGDASSDPLHTLFRIVIHDLLGYGPNEKTFLIHAAKLAHTLDPDRRARIALVALGHAIALFAKAPAAHLSPDSFRRTIANQILQRTQDAERLNGCTEYPTPQVSQRLSHAFFRMDDPVRLAEELGSSMLGLENIPYAIAIAALYPHNFGAALREAKKVFLAPAMVGAILGARVGLEGIPSEWTNALENKDALLAEADLLSMQLPPT